MVFLACSILCCLILKKSSVFDRERDPLKEKEVLTSNRLCLISCQAVSNTFKKSLKFLTKLDIPLSFKCSFPVFKCFFKLILWEIVSIPLFSQNSLSRVFTFSAFVLQASPLGTILFLSVFKSLEKHFWLAMKKIKKMLSVNIKEIVKQKVWTLHPPSIDNPPLYILSEPPAFAKTFSIISPHWNTK